VVVVLKPHKPTEITPPISPPTPIGSEQWWARQELASSVPVGGSFALAGIKYWKILIPVFVGSGVLQAVSTYREVVIEAPTPETGGSVGLIMVQRLMPIMLAMMIMVLVINMLSGAMGGF